MNSDGKRSEMHEMHERRGSRLRKENYIHLQGGSSKGGRAPSFFRDGKRESKETLLKMGNMGTLIG